MVAWYEDVRQLWTRPDEFFPMHDMSEDERLNAIVRLIAYAVLAVSLFTGDPKYLLFGLASVAIVSVSHAIGRGAGPAADSFGLEKRQKRCTRPTLDNPFMNPTIVDPGMPPACPYDSVADEVWKGFDRGLFKNLEDVYEVENSQRQFYPMPRQDLHAFAEFCYGSRGKTCKEDPSKCRPWFATRT